LLLSKCLDRKYATGSTNRKLSSTTTKYYDWHWFPLFTRFLPRDAIRYASAVYSVVVYLYVRLSVTSRSYISKTVQDIVIVER